MFSEDGGKLTRQRLEERVFRKGENATGEVHGPRMRIHPTATVCWSGRPGYREGDSGGDACFGGISIGGEEP